MTAELSIFFSRRLNIDFTQNLMAILGAMRQWHSNYWGEEKLTSDEVITLRIDILKDNCSPIIQWNYLHIFL